MEGSLILGALAIDDVAQALSKLDLNVHGMSFTYMPSSRILMSIHTDDISWNPHCKYPILKMSSQNAILLFLK